MILLLYIYIKKKTYFKNWYIYLSKIQNYITTEQSYFFLQCILNPHTL